MKGFHLSIYCGIIGVLLYFLIEPLMGIFFMLFCIFDASLQNTSLISKKLENKK